MRLRNRDAARTQGRPAYVLIAVLITIVILTLAAYRFTDSMTAEHTVAVRTTQAAQAKSYAISGIHYAAAMVSDPTTLQTTLGGTPGDTAAFSNVSVGDSAPRGGGRFSLLYPADSGVGTGESRYTVKSGVADESARWNINVLIAADPTGKVLHDALLKLPNMTEDLANDIIDWVTPGDTPVVGGAKSDYYSGLTPPYRSKNGPLNSIEELLLVRGVTPLLLLGTDRNRNGRLDGDEAAGGDFSRGWADFLTVHGRELNVDSSGNPRQNLDDGTLSATDLMAKLVPALGQEMADYVIAVRLYGTSPVAGAAPATPTPTTTTATAKTTATSGNTKTTTTTMTTTTTVAAGSATITGGAAELRTAVAASLTNMASMKNKVSKLTNLQGTQVTLPKPAGSPPNAPTVNVPSPLNDKTKLADLLPKLMDGFTLSADYELAPRLNVNSAAPEALAGLPGLTDADVSALTTARSSLSPTDLSGVTGTWMVTAGGLSMAKYAAIEPYVSGRTMTYRAHSVGYFASGGPVARMEAVIDTNLGYPRILYFRDLSDLGRGFDLPR